jgi:L-ascorbate metabolism protein UlaG (beta-lactamase superfamily)
MKIRYLFNSGYTLEFGDRLLIIDFFRDKAAVVTPEYLGRFASVTVLVSHSHPDHFNPEIFTWSKYSRTVTFVLWDGIGVNGNNCAALTGGQVMSISEGASVSANGFDIRAYGSTDEGVSFAIKTDGQYIFHAGDLNFWHWRNEADDAFVDDALEQYERVADELVRDPQPIDIAFFPVDPRMGATHWEGALMFIERFRPRAFIPMHFGHTYDPGPDFTEQASVLTHIFAPQHPGDELDV